MGGSGLWRPPRLEADVRLLLLKLKVLERMPLTLLPALPLLMKLFLSPRELSESKLAESLVRGRGVLGFREKRPIVVSASAFY